ncbi:hypothetical protein SPRG_18679 [Saprolegnia parasitica CBS 223.65]|uniref:PX domain-containing protein n=1 Tax=Saprolegnia parasitica (strain CBS 223.65) TaxID=695850 RepID=A0A067BGC5_SAPPC|nr:hypothetical protein SPRG_18679 [Saprolegnia parasitica CBS 223.65]KDO15780.1 hypothetical protein SPRG_18679 [Saprolegnia parasitica CBS 223.65]|eukprot:XP_012213512.1 hypothetical protein SPRG_18679 [Saprolegnia parasitica CBS 223.65]
MIKTRGVLGTKVITRGGLEAAMDPFALSICRVQVAEIAHEQSTCYAVQSQNAISGRSWVVYRRYSDFALFREKLLCHFQGFVEVVPKAFNRMMGLPFPKKQAFPRKATLRAREAAFLAFIRAVHDILLDPEYFLHHDVSYMGFAIFKGFLGSRLHVLHHNMYHVQKTVPQHQLPRRERACVIQCGTLATIMEEPAPVLVLKRIASDEAEMSMTTSVASDDDDDDEADPRYTPALKRKSSWTAKAHRVLSVKRLSKSQLLPAVA